MTQKEIVIMVLKKLGGRAHLDDIYILGKAYIGERSSAKSVEANIRRELNTNHDHFCHVDGMPDGWWQLCNYKNELTKLKERVKEQDEELKRLRSVITDREILSKLVDTVKEMDTEAINAHELSLNRLSREMDHRYDDLIDKLTGKSIERAEHRSINVILADKTEVKNFNGNYNARVEDQHNHFPLPPASGVQQLKEIER